MVSLKKSTTDYDKFQFLNNNREINSNHLKLLIRSIQENNLLEYEPILVNSDMEVIDGQHRLMAAKTLGVAIWYSVEKNIHESDMVLLNTVKRNWKLQDFLNYYARTGKKEYVKLEKYLKDNNLSVSIIGHLKPQTMDFNKGRLYLSDFKKGNFIFEEKIDPEKIFVAKHLIEYFYEKHPDVVTKKQYMKSPLFLGSMIAFLDNEIDIERFKKNFLRCYDLLAAMGQKTKYVDCFKRIYNYLSRDKLE